MPNKQQKINKLNVKTKIYQNKIQVLNQEISLIQKQARPTINKKAANCVYTIAQEKKLYKSNLKLNILKGKLFKTSLLLQQLNLISSNEQRTWLNSDELYQFIKKFETLDDSAIHPFTFKFVIRMRMLSMQIMHHSNKLKHLKSNTPTTNKLINKKIEKEIKKIEEYHSFLSSTVSLFKTTYHAKLVKKLESMKKITHDYFSNKSNNKVIELRNVAKYYYTKSIATKALDNVNIEIKKGEFVVILGPSGSGKTTLLNIISGMDNATYGDTIIAGENLINYNQNELTTFRRKNIGYVFQQYGLLPNLNVKENVEIGKKLQADPSKAIDIDQVLRSVNMYPQIKKYPNELSGGQQQRVSIARSVVKNPNILFGDEPTGAIDQETSKQIMDLFVRLNKEYNTTIIIVTHNPILAELATLVINVADGAIKSVVKNTKRKSIKDLNWNMTYNTKK